MSRGGEDSGLKADQRARRLALVTIAGAAVVGVLAIVASERYRPVFESWLESDPATTVPLTLVVLAVLGAVPVLGLAWHVWRIGRRTVEAGRFPPPGLRPVRDTPLLVGELATRRGRTIQGLALLLGAAAIGLALALWRLASVFESAGA